MALVAGKDGTDPADPAADRAWVLAFEAFSRRMRPALRAFFLRRVRSETDVDELVQDLLLRLFRQRDLFSMESLDAYVFQAAGNLLKDRARRAAARSDHLHVVVDDEALAATDPSAEDVVDARQRLARLLTAVKSLPPRTRAVLMLRRFEDLSHAEIAERLNLSVSAVEKHMAKAIAALRLSQ